MKYVCPALFVWDDQEKVYNTEVTDLPGCFAFGETISAAIAATRDAICEWLINSEDKNEAIPPASPLPQTQPGDKSFYTLIDADTLEYRNMTNPFDGLLSFKEATDRWGLNESTLRKAVAYGKLVEGVDCKKFGKQWIVTEQAMIREYGPASYNANEKQKQLSE